METEKPLHSRAQSAKRQKGQLAQTSKKSENFLDKQKERASEMPAKCRHHPRFALNIF
jgi:hypothetical protein